MKQNKEIEELKKFIKDKMISRDDLENFVRYTICSFLVFCLELLLVKCFIEIWKMYRTSMPYENNLFIDIGLGFFSVLMTVTFIYGVYLFYKATHREEEDEKGVISIW